MECPVGQPVPSGVNLCPLLPGNLEMYYTKTRKKEDHIGQLFEEGVSHRNCSISSLFSCVVCTYAYSLSLLFL